MLQIFKKYKNEKKMIAIWLFVILIGTILTILGSYKLSSTLGKSDIIRQSHIIPDFLLIDFKLETELSKELTEQILNEVKPKINVPNKSVDSLDKIDLLVFFNDEMFESNQIYRKNYKLSDSIYEQLRNFEVFANSTSKDSSVYIDLNQNSNRIIFSNRMSNSNESYIEVSSYDVKRNKFELYYHNIQLNVVFKRQSKYFLDLDGGNLELFFVTSPIFINNEISSIKIKTKTTDYFNAVDVIKDEENMIYNSKLKLILR